MEFFFKKNPFYLNHKQNRELLQFQLTPKLTLPFLGGKRLPKLFVTMVIRNVTLDDDSTYGALGRYECHAFAVGDPLERRHGFSVNVIRSKSFTWLSSRSVLAA